MAQDILLPRIWRTRPEDLVGSRGFLSRVNPSHGLAVQPS